MCDVAAAAGDVVVAMTSKADVQLWTWESRGAAAAPVDSASAAASSVLQPQTEVWPVLARGFFPVDPGRSWHPHLFPESRSKYEQKIVEIIELKTFWAHLVECLQGPPGLLNVHLLPGVAETP